MPEIEQCVCKKLANKVALVFYKTRELLCLLLAIEFLVQRISR
jgi:hypothetical protein